MLKVRCRSCGTEMQGQIGKTQCCGCSNMTTVTGDKVSARDLGQVVMVHSGKEKPKNTHLSPEDLSFQEQRKKRKVRKLDFDIKQIYKYDESRIIFVKKKKMVVTNADKVADTPAYRNFIKGDPRYKSAEPLDEEYIRILTQHDDGT